MIREGLLTKDDRVELLDGLLIAKPRLSPQHATAVGLVADILREVLPETYCLRQSHSVTLAESEPEPDVAVVRGGHRDYRDRHPHAEDCSLLVEVADSSLARDTYKARLYAAAGVHEYWILDLPNRHLIVHRNPSADGYGDVSTGDVAETVVGDATLRVDVAELP